MELGIPPASFEQNVAWLECVMVLFVGGRFINEGYDYLVNGCYVDEKALVLVISAGDFQVVRHGAWKESRAKSFRGGEKSFTRDADRDERKLS